MDSQGRKPVFRDDVYGEFDISEKFVGFFGDKFVGVYRVVKEGEKLTEGEVEQYCISRIARYKRPRVIKFVDSLIRNEAGKVNKKKLKEMYGGK